MQNTYQLATELAHIKHLGMDARPGQITNKHLNNITFSPGRQPHHHQNQLALHGAEPHKIRLERLPPWVVNERALVRLLQSHDVIGRDAPDPWRGSAVAIGAVVAQAGLAGY